MKRIVLLFLTVLATMGGKARDVIVKSPSGQLIATLKNSPWIALKIQKDGHEVMAFETLGVDVAEMKTTRNVVRRVTRRNGDEWIRPIVPLRQAEIHDTYNECVVDFSNKMRLVVRVMDNAVAYRWQLPALQTDSLHILNEQMTLKVSNGLTVHIQPCNSFNTSYEEAYRHLSISEWQEQNQLATLPVLFSANDGSDLQVLIGESDVTDYPHMFLHGRAEGLCASFPRYPEAWEPRGDRGEKITKESDFMAKSKASATLPWRYAVITDSKGIIEQTVPIQLAPQSVLDDTSWIRPGKVSWEWWNGATPYGPDVHFKAGNNFETYQYFIDFAAHYGIEYILLDEGWAQSTTDPFAEKPGLRLHELIAYGEERGVGIFLWLPWLTVEQHFDLFQRYAEWGVKGIKIDFMDHADQWMNDYYRRVAREAARHHLMVDFHGSFSPAGLEQEYPNVISYEGVRGLEQMGGCRPENTVFVPFIRNAVGPADFTPGAMNNMQPERYHADRPNSGAMGTRVFQMALYVVLESGVQMLADNPTLYYRNDDCTRYIASVPVVWDETRCLAADAGNYAVVARHKGSRWFVGAICNGAERERKFTFPLSFLKDGQSYSMTAFSDGPNADWQAMDYDCTKSQVSSTSQLDITLARNGGWAAVIEEASLADSLSQSLIDNFWGASFKGYESRFFFNKSSQMADLSTGDYWPQAHAIDVITDAYLRTGNGRYRSLFAKWFSGMPRFNPSGRAEDPWWNVYVDDMEWHALALIRIYEATGETQYLDKARQMFDDWIWTQWSEKNEAPWHGGITWKTDIAPSKNACSNGPAAIIAARLAHFDEAKTQRLIQAQQIFEWLRNSLYNPTNGAVYDHIDKNGNIAKWTFTYNQGTFLGAAHELYKLTGRRQYLADAVQAARFVISHMSTNGGVPSDATDGDGALFHGIFFRYLANLILEPDLDQTSRRDFTDYILHCANVISREGINHQTMLYGGRWHEPAASNSPIALNAQLTACMLMEAVHRVQNSNQ